MIYRQMSIDQCRTTEFYRSVTALPSEMNRRVEVGCGWP